MVNAPHEHPTPDAPRAAPSAILITMDTERSAAASLSPEEHKAYKRRALAALDDIAELHREILERRGGVVIDVYAELAELRGRSDESSAP